MRKFVQAGIALAVLGGIGWLGACVDDPSGPGSQNVVVPPPEGAIVSDPVPAAGVNPEVGSASALASAGDEVAYVSLPPGTEPTGTVAVVRRVGDAASLTTALVDGGFDPVPVAAQVGDSIDILVRDALGATLLHARIAVLPRRPPVVVRTDPPREKTDVAINSTIIIVLSEPIDESTITSQNIRLVRREEPVTGTLVLIAGGLRAELQPDSLLEPEAEYRLTVTTSVADLDGDRLEQALEVPFTTGAIDAPSNTQLVAVSESRIDVFWQDNSASETGFEIHRRFPSPDSTFTLRVTTGSNVDNYGDPGLEPSTEYCYKIRAFKTSNGNVSYSGFSNAECTTTLAPSEPSPPGGPLSAPIGTSAVPVNSSTVDVSWTDDSSAEEGFRVERSTDGGTSFRTVGTTGPNATSFSDGGAQAEALHCYRVVAFSDLGESPPSSGACAGPIRGPTNLTAGWADQQAVLVAWHDRSSYEESYEVQRSAAESGPFTTVATLSSSSGFQTLTHRENVPSGGIHWYRVRATNDGGFSDFSNTAATTNDAAPPNAPAGANATHYGGTLSVSWTDNSLNEEGFRVERSVDGGTSWVTAATTGVNDWDFWGAWLTAEQLICHRVIAFNGMGDSPPSNSACTALPAAPGPLTGAAVDHQTIDLTWADNSNVEDAYQVESSDGYSGFLVLAMLPANTTSFRDVGLGGPYYQVRALKGNSYSGTSNQVEVFTPPWPVGSVEVATATTGVDLDPDGYVVSVDGGPGNSIDLNGVLTFTLTEGDHTIALGGIAANCAVEETSSRVASVVAGATTRVDFAVTCETAGRLRVTVVTTGVELDPDGFSVSVDGESSQTIPTNGSTTISNLLSGEYLVRLSGVAANCEVTSANPSTVTVSVGTAATVGFEVACAPVTQLAFADRRGSAYADIFVVNSNGTGVIRLTTHPEEDLMPAWSPDGSKIAFVSYHRDSFGPKIYVMNADGSSPKRVTNSGVGEYEPTWSPDGTRIAFHGAGDGDNSGIYVVNADGTNTVPLRLTYYPDREPAWSPDGDKIAFSQCQTFMSNCVISVMSAEGTGAVRLTADTGDDIHPAWSADGTKIAFSRCGGYRSDCDIFVMNADGSGVMRVVTGPFYDPAPSWSPNGRKIAFNAGLVIHVATVDRADVVELTEGFNPAWRR